MKIDLFAMPTIHADSWEEREKLRPIGRNTERYQHMIEELRVLVAAADEMGVDAFSTTEHHLHTEGGEAMPNPLMLFADLAGRTKNIMLMPLSIVLPTHDPIRVAEDIALLDQLTKGRAAVGLARGYQKRWVQILSQGGSVPLNDELKPSETEQLNREIFNEYYDILINSWTKDAWDYDGKHYQVPFPYKDGISGWAGAEWTRRFGADGEVDDEGIVRRIGVIPRPYQDPHPQVFVPFTASPATLIQAAGRSAVPFILEANPERFRKWCELYQEESAKAGHERELGHFCGAVRNLALGKTREEAFENAVTTAGYEFHNYFNKFGFGEVFRTPADDPNKLVTFKDEVELTKRMIETGALICGTVDDVKRQVEVMHKCYGDSGELEWMSWNFFFQGTHSMDEQLEQLDLFMNKVMPSFR